MKPSHKQISFLSGMLKTDEALQKHFDMERTQERLMNIRAYNLYRYILYLYINKHRSKLNTILTRLGFKVKKI
jgi:hypothetical protein